MNGIRKKSKMDSERPSKIQARLDDLKTARFPFQSLEPSPLANRFSSFFLSAPICACLRINLLLKPFSIPLFLGLVLLFTGCSTLDDGLTREEFDSICEGVLMFSGEALNGLSGTGF